MGDTAASGDSFTFSAFISYARNDRAEAVRLQRRLEQYRLDADLRVKEGERFFPARPLQPVFRDEDELVPGQDLPERIRKGLIASRYLVVLASTASVQSRWVEKEILDFMALGKADRIIILVIDGEPNAAKAGKKPELESLPRPFRMKFTADGQPTDQPVAEPNWVDWRGRRKSDRINFLRLVSALLELDRFDDLLRRDARAERRRLRVFQAATSVFVALGLAAALGAVLAAQQLDEVRTTESRFLARLSDDLAEPKGDAARGDHLRALQIAVEGAPTTSLAVYPRPLTVETESALRRSVSHLRLSRFMQHTYAVRAAAMSADGRRIATVSRSEVPWVNFSIVTLWDGESGALVHAPTKVADGAFADNFEIAFSPDGKRVLATAGNAAHLFDAATGARIGQPLADPAGRDPVQGVRFSADSLRMVMGDELWDARTGARIRTYPSTTWMSEALNRFVTLPAKDTTQLIDGVSGAAIGGPVKHDADILTISFSRDRIAIATRNNKVSLWDATTGSPTGIVVRTAGGLKSAELSPDGARLLTIVGKDGGSEEAQLWNEQTGAAVGNAVVASSAMASTFSPDGSRLVLSSPDVRVLDTTTGAAVTIKGRVLSFSPNGAFLLTESEGVQLWNATSGEAIGDAIVRSVEMTGVAFSPDNSRFLVGSLDGVGLFETTGRFLDELKHDDPATNARFSTITHVSTLSASFSADSSSILTASSDTSARLWNAQTSLLVPRKLTHPGHIRAFAVSPDGQRLATAGEDKMVRLQHARSGGRLGAAMMHEAAIERVAFSRNGTRLLTIAGGVHIWNAYSGAAIGVPFKPKGNLTEAIFSPDGTRVATSSDDNAVILWNADTGAQIGSAMTHASEVRGVAFSPDGTRLLTISGPEEGALPDETWGAPNGEARLWNAMTGAPIGRAMTHSGFVEDATFSPDGTQVATASFDKTVRLWDGHTGAPLQSLKHAEKAKSVAFNADGSRILTRSFGELDSSGEAHLWSAMGKRIADMAQGNPTNARFSPDGTRVATVGFGTDEMYLFDAATGKPIASMTHRGAAQIASGAIFSPDGTILATSGSGTVQLWDARTGASIGAPLDGEVTEDADVFAAGTARLLAARGGDVYLWNIDAWSQTGAPLVAHACEALTSTGAGALPPDLSDRAFRRSGTTRPCGQRGLLDWRFYTDALLGGR